MSLHLKIVPRLKVLLFRKIYQALEKVLLPSSLKQIDSFAFAECETLVELNFEGDSSEWETIEKIWDWRYDCRLKRIVCLDKTVYIN